MKLLFASLATVAVLTAQSGPPPALAPGEWLPASGARSQALGVMAERRQEAAWTVTGDGRILASGGSTTPTTEWFDPKTRRFQSGPALVHPRAGHRALRLRDGRILLLGGTDQPRPAEVSDPGVRGFKSLEGAAVFNFGAEAAELPDGKVLLVDGMSGKAWLWDGKKVPSAAGTLVRNRVLFRLTPLPDGRVLASGGLPTGKSGAAPLPLELGNPRRGSWSALKAAVQPRARHQAMLQRDGSVLLWGGHGADARVGTEALERVDPARDKVSAEGRLHAGWGVVPAATAAAEGWLVAPDRGAGVVRVPSDRLPEVLASAPEAALPTLNRFAEAALAATAEGCLLLGTALSGPNLERWDPRTKVSQPFGVLRPGTEGLMLLPDRRVLAVCREVVDVLDLRSGVLAPLGWREDLKDLLRKAKRLEPPAKPLAWPKGEARKGHLLVPLDRNRVLVVAGSPEGTEATKLLSIWESGRKKLSPAGILDTPRRFTGAPGEGALRLPDGTVAIWGGVPGV